MTACMPTSYVITYHPSTFATTQQHMHLAVAASVRLYAAQCTRCKPSRCLCSGFGACQPQLLLHLIDEGSQPHTVAKKETLRSTYNQAKHFSFSVCTEFDHPVVKSPLTVCCLEHANSLLKLSPCAPPKCMQHQVRQSAKSLAHSLSFTLPGIETACVCQIPVWPQQAACSELS